VDDKSLLLSCGHDLLIFPARFVYRGKCPSTL